MNRPLKDSLKELIEKQLKLPDSSFNLQSIGGGSINDTYQLTIDGQRKLFLKVNSREKFPGLFEKEKDGLQYLAQQKCILVPAVEFVGTIDHYQLLVLEWIEQGIRDEKFWKKFGEQLASLHSSGHEQCGYKTDNYMGSLPQMNNFADNWGEFFIQRRLHPQIELASTKKLLQKKHIASFESLFKKLDSFFELETASLLHGDLWSGNFMCNEKSAPVLIDPAIYFGHRSVDLAMTTLFGGFDRVFYDSYNYHFPFPSNFREQWDICNLYPLLVHLNLFGSGYLHQIEEILRRFN
jgi:fructosamine-3-kinase